MARVLTEQSRSYLEQLDAGEGEVIPTLWQVMEIIAGRCELHIELKGTHTADAVAALTRRAEAELDFTPGQWVVSSFHHPELARFAASRPDIRLGALTANLPLNLAQFADELGAWSINCDVDFIDAALVDDAHRRGSKFWFIPLIIQKIMKRSLAWGSMESSPIDQIVF